MKQLYFLIAGTCLLAACGSEKKDKLPTDVVNISATADSTQVNQTNEKAAITFETERHDFGRLVDGEVVEYSFKFKNTGTGDLLIANASASCGCTVPDYPKQLIKPGEDNFIKVRFDSKGKIGTFEKSVMITANTEPRETVIYITGLVVEK